jgi:hypothetical protein
MTIDPNKAPRTAAAQWTTTITQWGKPTFVRVVNAEFAAKLEGEIFAVRAELVAARIRIAEIENARRFGNLSDGTGT